MIAPLIRQFLYGLFVYSLLIFSHSAFADTYPPTKAWVMNGVPYDSPEGFCNAYRAYNGFSPHESCPDVYAPWGQSSHCKYKVGSSPCNSISITGSNICPYGGWYQYESGLCVSAPVCPAEQQRDETGQCVPIPDPEPPNDCQPKQGQIENTDYAFSLSNDSENAGPGDVICSDGCQASVVFSGEARFICGFSASGFGSCTTVQNVQSVFNGESCSGSNPAKNGPDLPSNRPPCEEGQGVITSTSGNVMCLPAGTPNARKPVESESLKKETFPDGTEKTTTTKKTTDPKTGATDTKTTTTTTGGMSGPGGTSSSEETTSGKNGGDDGDDDRSAGGGCEGFTCSGDAIDCSIAEASWKAACIPESRKTTGGDNCDAAPTCEGDAIDCAILKKQWENNCLFDWAKKENEFSDAFNSAKAKMDDPDKFVHENDDNFFKLENHVSGSSACPAAIVIPVFGRTIDAPTDWICGYLGLIAIVLKVLAWLFVGRMVLGAF